VKGIASILVPLVDEVVIPVSKPSLQFGFALGLLGGFELSKEQAQLLAERVQALPPVAAAVLVSVAYEYSVQQLVDVVQHGFVVRSDDHQSHGVDAGRAGHGGGGGNGHFGCGDATIWYVDRCLDGRWPA
jgi:hypothetical protein